MFRVSRKRNKNTSESLEMRRETETQTQRLGRLSVSVDIGDVGTERNSRKYVYVYICIIYSSSVSEALRSVSLISRMHGYLYRETRSHCFLMFINKEKRKKKNSNEMKELLPE